MATTRELSTLMANEISNKHLLKEQGFIGGSWVSGTETFPVFDPSTDKPIANVANLGIDSFKDAICHAEESFKTFGKTSEHEPSRFLHKFAALIRANADDLAIILTHENGKTLAEAKGEVEYGASFISWFAEEAVRSYGSIIPSQHSRSINFVVRQPIGPPSETPLCALALSVLALEAGIPHNVVQAVPSKDRTAVAELYSNPAVKKVSFTGSTGVGKLIMEKSARTMKKVSMELGGNAPYIVFDDADVAKAVEGVVACKFRCSGQTCICANRLFVQRGIHDSFVSALEKRMTQFKVGPGMDPSVTHGPMVNEAAVMKVREHIDDAVSKGAKLVVGGKLREDLGSCFIEPALMTGATPSMMVAREETFGPLAPVFVFDTVEEVTNLANDTEFDLAGYFFSSSLDTIWRVASELEVGMVGVNTGKISAAEAPFGGMKESGYGKEGSVYGLAEYQVIKNVTLSM